MTTRFWTMLPAGAKTYPTQADALAAAKRMADLTTEGMIVCEAICIARPTGAVDVLETLEPADVA